MGSNRRHIDSCRSRFEDILVKLGDPRIERWMHKLAEAMQDGVEQEVAEEACMKEAQTRQDSSSSGENTRLEDSGAEDVPGAPQDQPEEEEDLMDVEDDDLMAVHGGQCQDDKNQEMEWWII